MRFDFVYIVCRLFERAYIVCFDQDQNILNVQASQALLSFASMFSYPSHGFRRATKKNRERERPQNYAERRKVLDASSLQVWRKVKNRRLHFDLGGKYKTTLAETFISLVTKRLLYYLRPVLELRCSNKL